MKKGIIIILAIAVLGGIGAYFYVFHKPHRDPSAEAATFQIMSVEIAQEFGNNEAAATEKYLDKVVEVKGTVLEVDGSTVILDNVVSCAGATVEAFNGVQEGDELVVKGRVIGFDDLFGEVKLDNCVKL